MAELLLDAAVDSFVLDARARGLSERTIEFYLAGVAALRCRLPSPLEAQTLDMLQLDAVRALAVALRGQVAPSTLAGRLRALKVFSRWCMRERYLRRDPLERLVVPRVPDTEIARFSDAQVRALLGVASAELGLALRLLFDTGLRIGELTSLRVDDLQRGGLLVVGKGGHRRFVPLGRRAERDLRRALVRRDAGPGAPLLVQRGGAALTAAAVAQGMRRLSRRLGLNGVRVSPHTCRHTFATAFLANGGSLLALQQILGHHDLAMVRRYVHLSPEQLAAQHRAASPLDHWTAGRQAARSRR